jgi:S-adenosylmethionine-diacylglycerol 3-amino-3-carboxypropyl transferase
MYVKPKIVYSNVWEDPELNRKALQIIPQDVVLSITSGGCNSLNLLLENPKKVISIDCNPGQVALLDLKIAAFKELTHEELWDFLGVRIYQKPERISPDQRLVLYGRVSKHLRMESREFFDQHLNQIKEGVIHCGSVEHFFGMYRKVVRTLYAFDGADRVFFAKTLKEQQAIYSKIFKNRIRLLNHLILNKVVLGLVKGRHSFKYVNNLNFGRNFNLKLRHAFNHTLLYDNYFLAYILLGAYTAEDHVPPYLKASNFETMKSNIDRLDNRLATLADVLKTEGPQSISKFNLSNIFEWYDTDAFNEVLRETLELAAPGARLCYRYTLARAQPLDRQNSEALEAEKDLADKLFFGDRAFMYESFHVYHLRDSLRRAAAS